MRFFVGAGGLNLGCPFDVVELDWVYNSGALKSPKYDIFTRKSHLRATWTTRETIPAG